MKQLRLFGTMSKDAKEARFEDVLRSFFERHEVEEEDASCSEMNPDSVSICAVCGNEAERISYSIEDEHHVWVYACENCGSTIVQRTPMTEEELNVGDVLSVYGSSEKAKAACEYEDVVLTITQKIALASAESIVRMLHDTMEQMTDAEKLDALYILRENLNSLFSD